METSWGTIQGLSLNFGIWIKDAGWSPGCGTPDNDNAKIQSSLLARDSSKPKDQNPRTDSKGEVFSEIGPILKLLF